MMCIIEYSNILIKLLCIILKNSFRSNNRFYSYYSLSSVDSIDSVSLSSYEKVTPVSSLFIIDNDINITNTMYDQHSYIKKNINMNINICSICQKNLHNKIIFRQNDESYCRKCCPWKRKSKF